ncbi:formylglycine-generating enzyme family protein [Lysobacter sp. FW306-1B-D06B]|uniref:formylglycine-generating enzyme family protein n=1 Tax=Lysobacter sp. FW306-1B-D06B TaxID=3140250 RepID=UPI00313FE29F
MLTSALLWWLLAAPATAPPDFAVVPGGMYRSTVRYEGDERLRRVDGFAMQRRAVTVREFEAFVRVQSQWRRDRVPSLLADSAYLAHWRQADAAGQAPETPVTQVSWFAADAYCASIGARLPDWTEWEFAAAADATRRDARGDAAWRARLLDDGTPRGIDARPGAPANAYGVSGLHGANWEWVGDHASLLGDSDKRGSDDGDRLRFCGATGLSFADRDDYAVLKRVALLSAMAPRSTLGNLGFHCVREAS